MATIKLTHITASMPDKRNRITGRYIKYYTFKTFIDNMGNKTYYLNGDEVAKEYGNKIYKEIKELGKDIEREDIVREVTYEELIEDLLRGYDNFVEYIDDGRQYQAAKKHNAEIMEEVNKLKKMIEDEK